MSCGDMDMRRADFPTGYFDCCGMSRARGHSEYCQRIAIAMETREGEDVQQASSRSDDSAGRKASPNMGSDNG